MRPLSFPFFPGFFLAAQWLKINREKKEIATKFKFRENQKNADFNFLIDNCSLPGMYDSYLRIKFV